MGNGVACIPTDKAGVRTSQLEQSGSAEEAEPQSAFVAAAAKVNGFIAVIESRTFLRECIRRSARLALPLPIITYATVFELEQQHSPASPAIVIVSLTEAGSEAVVNTLTKLSELFPGIPVIVFADKTDPELALTAIRHGARGYIPFTLGFDIAVEAVRLVFGGRDIRAAGLRACHRWVRHRRGAAVAIGRGGHKPRTCGRSRHPAR
jgi:DNA-binding NtrC family response regulator